MQGPLSSLLGEQYLVQLIRGIAVHLFSHMGIDIEGRADIAVTQPALDSLNVDAMFDHQGSRRVPLRYNYDKPEKPRRIKGFEVFSLIFSSFSKPKNHTEISRIAGGVSLTTNE